MKNHISPELKIKLKKMLGYYGILKVKYALDFLKSPLYISRHIYTALTWKAKANKLSKTKEGLRLHLGCGDQHHSGMLNCEYRATSAADVVMDCGNLKRFRDNSSSLIFSNAFFEHLYIRQQIPLLKDCFRVLKEAGVLIFLMIPDFREVAKAYLNRLPGHPGRSEFFDLFQVYRNTHGDPEMEPTYWLEQLHKSLFDKESIQDLLIASGFRNYAIFNYTIPGEKLPVNLGFVAWKSKPENIMQNLRETLSFFGTSFAETEQALKTENLLISKYN